MPSATKESTAARLLREGAEEERHNKTLATAATNTRQATSFAEGSTPSRKRQEAEAELTSPPGQTPGRGSAGGTPG
eukprot:14392783-Heterocapsa_arctica.AAC.1